MIDNLFDRYTHSVYESGDDIPEWMFWAILALPFVLLAIDVIGG